MSRIRRTASGLKLPGVRLVLGVAVAAVPGVVAVGGVAAGTGERTLCAGEDCSMLRGVVSDSTSETTSDAAERSTCW